MPLPLSGPIDLVRIRREARYALYPGEPALEDMAGFAWPFAPNLNPAAPHGTEEFYGAIGLTYNLPQPPTNTAGEATWNDVIEVGVLGDNFFVHAYRNISGQCIVNMYTVESFSGIITNLGGPSTVSVNDTRSIKMWYINTSSIGIMFSDVTDGNIKVAVLGTNTGTGVITVNPLVVVPSSGSSQEMAAVAIDSTTFTLIYSGGAGLTAIVGAIAINVITFPNNVSIIGAGTTSYASAYKDTQSPLGVGDVAYIVVTFRSDINAPTDGYIQTIRILTDPDAVLGTRIRTMGATLRYDGGTFNEVIEVGNITSSFMLGWQDAAGDGRVAIYSLLIDPINGLADYVLLSDRVFADAINGDVGWISIKRLDPVPAVTITYSGTPSGIFASLGFDFGVYAQLMWWVTEFQQLVIASVPKQLDTNNVGQSGFNAQAWLGGSDTVNFWTSPTLGGKAQVLKLPALEFDPDALAIITGLPTLPTPTQAEAINTFVLDEKATPGNNFLSYTEIQCYGFGGVNAFAGWFGIGDATIGANVTQLADRLVTAAIGGGPGSINPNTNIFQGKFTQNDNHTSVFVGQSAAYVGQWFVINSSSANGHNHDFRINESSGQIQYRVTQASNSSPGGIPAPGNPIPQILITMNRTTSQLKVGFIDGVALPQIPNGSTPFTNQPMELNGRARDSSGAQVADYFFYSMGGSIPDPVEHNINVRRLLTTIGAI